MLLNLNLHSSQPLHSKSTFSSLIPEGSSHDTSEDEESIDDHIKDVTDDLHAMLSEVEVLKRNSSIYDSTTELQNMIRDAGRLSRRNSGNSQLNCFSD